MFIGRKTSLYVAVLLCYVANIVMMTTTNMGGLYAGRLIIWLRPNPETVESELDGIQASIEVERNLSQGVSVWDMFANPVDRRRTFLSVAAVTLQAASGAMYMIGR